MAYNRQQQDSVAARVNSDRADWEMSNPNEFTHGTHDRNLNQATPAGRGQIQKVESGHVFNPFNCTVTYVYNDAGERWRVKYETPNTGSNGQWWQYSDYISVGNPDSPKRVFQTLNRMSNSTTLSEEEFHYIFDSSGRLMHAAFAQTPTLSSPNNGKWYIESSPASSRAVVSYDYAPGGQVLTVLHRWGTWNQPNPPADGYYAYSNIQRSVYSYEAARGLRLTADFQLWSESSWSTDHKQEYGYDSNLDYLTSATYLASYTGSESWSYDAAGNRIGTGYSYDNLNRMASSPGYAYQNDVLGNRTWRNYGQSGVQRYIWDEVNRLKSLCGTSEGARYEYRADGMRVKKITGLTIEWVGDEYSASGYYDENLNQDLPTVRYFYDGQMPMEEDSTYKENSVSVRDYTQYGLGARGIDYIRNVHHSSGATVVFPIYDGHGNMVYTLSRGANETFSLGNKRIYGAWGDLRYDGNPGDGPNTQYCANLGHKLDNESGLTYMRARYYEPWTGRFISEDPALDGLNWYVYCKNNPLFYCDPNGNNPIAAVLLMISQVIGFSMGFTLGYGFMGIMINLTGGDFQMPGFVRRFFMVFGSQLYVQSIMIQLQNKEVIDLTIGSFMRDALRTLGEIRKELFIRFSAAMLIGFIMGAAMSLFIYLGSEEYLSS